MEAKERREQLLKHLDVVLKRSLKKFQIERGQKERLNLKWGRLIVQAIQAYGRLLETDELEERVAKLEEERKGCIMVPTEEYRELVRKGKL